MALFVFAVPCFTLWLVSKPPASEWREALGATFWWALPVGLVGLTLVLPGAMIWLHGRYVLRLEIEGREVRATLFALWGTSGQMIERDRLAAAGCDVIDPDEAAPAWRVRLPAEKIDWLFDLQGEFPEGAEAVAELFIRQP